MKPEENKPNENEDNNPNENNDAANEGEDENLEDEEVEVVEVVEELVEDEKGKKGKKKKKRRWRRVRKKKRRRSFDTNGIIHLNPLGYDALKDDHLKGFFYSSRIRKHLQKMNLITRDGYIIENPNEYWNHKRIVREHYKSSSPGRRVKKYKKIKKKKKGKRANKDVEIPMDKEDYLKFINEAKNNYDLEKQAEGGDGDAEKNPEPEKPQAGGGDDDF